MQFLASQPWRNGLVMLWYMSKSICKYGLPQLKNVAICGSSFYFFVLLSIGCCSCEKYSKPDWKWDKLLPIQAKWYIVLLLWPLNFYLVNRNKVNICMWSYENVFINNGYQLESETQGRNTSILQVREKIKVRSCRMLMTKWCT